MKISGQIWSLNNKYLIMELHQPYFSAWQRFGWLEGTEGYSISKKAWEKAKELKKKILIKTKYADYEITWTKASRYLNCEFLAKDNTLLFCIPRDAFTKYSNQDMDEKPTNLGSLLQGLSEEQMAILRKKLTK